MRKNSGVLGFGLYFVASALFGAAPDARVALVASLYREFAWEVVVIEPSAPGFISQPKAVLDRFLAPDLVQLILNDRACAQEAKEICWLDFSPIWSGNDPAAADLRVLPGSKTNEVLVRFVYPYSKEVVEITYEMVQANGLWRVANIRTKDWSLLSILKTPL